MVPKPPSNKGGPASSTRSQVKKPSAKDTPKRSGTTAINDLSEQISDLVKDISEINSSILLGQGKPDDKELLRQKEKELEELRAKYSKHDSQAFQDANVHEPMKNKMENTTQLENPTELQSSATEAQTAESSRSAPNGVTAHHGFPGVAADGNSLESPNRAQAPDTATQTQDRGSASVAPNGAAKTQTSIAGAVTETQGSSTGSSSVPPNGAASSENEDSDMKDVGEDTKIGSDDLNIEWDISGVQNIDPHKHVPQVAYGHLLSRSKMRYCIRYGSPDAFSTLLECIPPPHASYKDNKDVTKRSDRIIQAIVEHHRSLKEPLPMRILSKAKILSIYWDSKTGMGHASNLDVLNPDYGKRRPNTRCYTYLPPEDYLKVYDWLDNKTGFSHETLSMTKLWQKGEDNWEKFRTLHNTAVELENRFEERHMQGQPNRPGPLKMIGERSPATLSLDHIDVEPLNHRRRSLRKSTQQQTRQIPRQLVVPKLESPGTTKVQSPPQDDPKSKRPTPELRQEFHREFLEIFDLPKTTTYSELEDRYRVDYIAQWTKWKQMKLQID